MKRLILKKIVIVSQRDEMARVIEFDDRLTVLTGDNVNDETKNRTGKSLVIKSIYHAMGAKLKKYTTNWNILQIVTIISFLYEDKLYELYRNNDSFILKFDEEIKFFKTVSELRKFYVDFFGFHIRMPAKADDRNSVYAYPGAIFMPFYIDQDEGWDGSWDSFRDVFSAKWKEEILLYHMGVRTKEYYELLEEKVDLSNEQNENRREIKTYDAVIKNHTQKYKEYLDISLDIDEFQEDIVNLTNELNGQLKKKNAIKEELISCFDEMKELEGLYDSAERVYKELTEDIDFVENELPEKEIICPLCGTKHENSIENKFHIYSDIEECKKVMQDYFDEKSKLEKKVNKQSEMLQELTDYIAEIREILERKREEVTFKEIIIAEGSKSILEDMKNERHKLYNRYTFVNERLDSITKEQKSITRNGKHITKDYLQRLSVALQKLNVIDIDSKELKKFKPSFSSGGNDLPCAILAQVYTLYGVAAKHSQSVCAPIVLDAIFQQEPAKAKMDMIWDYVTNSQPDNSQLIISTTSIEDRKCNGKVIKLIKERELLQKDDYDIIKEEVERYRELMIEELSKAEKK